MIEVHNKQFLLTKSNKENPFFQEWTVSAFNNYRLLTHPNLALSSVKDRSNQLIILGNIYDYRNPKFSNQDIADQLFACENFELMLKEYSETSGENVLLVDLGEQLYIVNDACAQMEVYYNADFSTIGTQPKLIQRIEELAVTQDPIARKHFDSPTFQQKKTNVGIETQFEGIKHLIGNHFLDLQQKEQRRFYPKQKLQVISVEESAEKTKEILTGYLKSISHRSKVALPVTAGIDSRVILTCAMDAKIPNLEFFTIKFPWMDEGHNDLVISKRIAQKLNIKLDIYDISQKEIPDVPAFDESLSLHNPQFDASTLYVLKQFGDRNVTVVDGSIIGVTKNFFGKLLHISGTDLARMSGYPDSSFAARQFNRWLDDSKELFKKYGYHVLDMFFWEDRASNWMLTVKTKFLLVSNYYSIFNSRILFETMLLTKRKHREVQDHKIFNHILSQTENDLCDIPINPSLKRNLMLFGKKTGLYYTYRNITIKLGLLKFK